jgi:hypothetical protein
LSNIHVTEGAEINYRLKNVDVSKACGFDGIGNRILKRCADGITSFVNYSLLSGRFPDKWSRAQPPPPPQRKLYLRFL